MSDPAKALKENYYYFTRADQTASDVYTTFVLPLGVTCTRCVLQFRWTTGNSCYGEAPHVVTPAPAAARLRLWLQACYKHLR
jgi:hypothetical protein